MPLYRPVELRQFLDSLGQVPKRTLSQNFLIDGNIVAKIVQEVGLHKLSRGDGDRPTDRIFEIGAGPGVLTEAFVAAGKQVTVVEKDSGFARALQRFEGVTCHEADILTCQLETLIPSGAVIVSNLPYHLTTVILERVLPLSHVFSKAVFMVQEEFAQRLLQSRSVLSLMASFFCEVRYAFPVSSASFWPRPKVASAVITLTPRAVSLLEHTAQQPFFALLRKVFATKRKTLLHTLSYEKRGDKDLIAEILVRLGHSQTVRPEELDLEEWITLFRALQLF